MMAKMEAKDWGQSPAIDEATVERLARVIKSLADGRRIRLELNGRRVWLAEGTRLDVEVSHDALSKTDVVSINWLPTQT